MSLLVNLMDHWSIVTGNSDSLFVPDPRDCCSYALQTENGIILFDCGAGVDPARTIATLHSVGMPMGPIMLFLTHAHADHSGAASLLKRTFGSAVAARKSTADWMRAGDEATVSLDRARQLGAYPKSYVFQPCAIDRVLLDDEVLTIGGATIRVLASPGHSADHTSYCVTYRGKTALVAGDALFANGTVLLQNTWDCAVGPSCESVQLLGRLTFDHLLAGHGPPLLESGFDAVRIALKRIDHLLPPLNFA